MILYSPTNVAEAVATAQPHSDMRRQELEYLAEHFIDAHKASPGCLSIEVGTRHGGSALLMLMLLERLYEPAARPMLFTVDPYGGKPYKGGDVSGLRLYGDADYLAAKKLLAPYANHAHWYCEGVEVLEAAMLNRTSYWWRGDCRPVANCAFILLDGDHDTVTVCKEVRYALQLLAPKGALLIDNVDKDQFLLDDLRAMCGAKLEVGPLAPSGARQAILRPT